MPREILIAHYEALPGREQNRLRKLYADLFCYALKDLVATCEPLRAEAAEQMTDILTEAHRRAEYGTDESHST